MTGCLQWLDATGTKGGGSCLDRGCQKPSGSLVRKHGGQEQKSRQWSAERRLPPIARGKDTPRKRVGRPRRPLKGSRKPLRFSALRSPSLGGATREGKPRAPP